MHSAPSLMDGLAPDSWHAQCRRRQHGSITWLGTIGRKTQQTASSQAAQMVAAACATAALRIAFCRAVPAGRTAVHQLRETAPTSRVGHLAPVVRAVPRTQLAAEAKLAALPLGPRHSASPTAATPRIPMLPGPQACRLCGEAEAPPALQTNTPHSAEPDRQPFVSVSV